MALLSRPQHIFRQYLLTMALYGSDTKSFYSTPRPVVEMTKAKWAREDRMSPQLVAPSASKAIAPKSQETHNTAPTFLSRTFPALTGLSKDSGGRARQLAGQLMRTWNQATPTVIKTLSELGQELAPNGSYVVVTNVKIYQKLKLSRMRSRSTQSKKLSLFAKHMFCSYPYLSFDEEKSSMIVKLAPTPLHESFGPILADSIHNAILTRE